MFKVQLLSDDSRSPFRISRYSCLDVFSSEDDESAKKSLTFDTSSRIVVRVANPIAFHALWVCRSRGSYYLHAGVFVTPLIVLLF